MLFWRGHRTQVFANVSASDPKMPVPRTCSCAALAGNPLRKSGGSVRDSQTLVAQSVKIFWEHRLPWRSRAVKLGAWMVQTHDVGRGSMFFAGLTGAKWTRCPTKIGIACARELD